MSARLQTSAMIEKVKDQIESMATGGVLEPANLEKFTDDNRVFVALVRADRKVMQELDIVTDVIFNIPAGVSDVLLTEKDDLTHTTSIDRSKLKQLTNQIYLDLYTNIQVDEVRSNHVEVYENYPLGDERPAQEIPLVNAQEFGMDRPGLRPDADNFVTFDAYSKRLRFKNALNNQRFGLVRGFVLPIDVGISEVDQSMIDAYQTLTPAYGEGYFLIQALKDLIPFGTQARQAVMAEEIKEKKEAINGTPSNTTPIRLKSKYKNSRNW